MTKSFGILLITAFMYGCSGEQSEQHTHEDGTTHEAHEGDHSHVTADTSHKQEEFNAADTTSTGHRHDHAPGDDHSHEGDHKH
jgi:hypothetical protein